MATVLVLREEPCLRLVCNPELFAKAVCVATGQVPRVGSRYLAVLYLLLIEQRSAVYIARKFGITVKTVSMHRLRAREQLGFETLGQMERDILVAYGMELERVGHQP